MSSYLDHIPDYSLYAYPLTSSRTSALQHLRAHQSEPNPLISIKTLDPQKIEKHRRNSLMAEMQSQALMDSTSASYAGDKRRNKLGYHRTAMACSHCRRRKIRCLMAAGDQQKRCSNCIKLKRECHFQPVDNQPGDRRSRANSKSDFLSDMSAESSPVQAHSIGQMDASLDSYPATSMMPGFDPSIAVYGDGLPRASTWNGVEYVDHGNMQPTDHISVDPYGVPFNATSMSIDSESITTLSRPQSNHWASNTPPLSTFHGHAISYPVSQSGIEDLVSLPTSTNGGAHNWPTGFQNHPSMYSRNQMSYSAGYQDPLHHHYESPRVQASYHSR